MALARAQAGLRLRGVALLWAPGGALGVRSRAGPLALCLPPRAAPFPFSLRYSGGSGQAGAGAAGGGPALPARPKGLYELLRVPSNATQAQIKSAYYKQSFLYHPDHNAGSEAAARRFTLINEAYLVLGSVALRRKYDRGILSREDLRTAGKPSGKESSGVAPTAATGRRTQTYASTHRSDKPIFDFDEFYRAHYGQQLERERWIREMRQELERRKMEDKRGKLGVLQEVVIAGLFMVAIGILFSFK
ncbi:dnaJ homolog subfamily C member 30, mitochondrial [Rhineura floridana]|uniref:dnaJ homolog subfamily C member 30, mitochondrial n=1 Tax=Rhineura floridana TaxID=261503 RepID=UPI002AC8831F|nr:dnaJ homolog subfamily C member 30, mitochondrial [Rhineura floridana]